MAHPVAVIFHRFGPYHCARLRAAAAHVPVLGVEIVRKDAINGWDVVDGPQGFRRVTLYPDANGNQPRVGDLSRRLWSLLAVEQPKVVAIPGWSESYSLLALSWCLKTGTPAVLMSESTAYDRPVSRLRDGIKRRLLRLFRAALVGGSRHIEYLHYLGFDRSALFPGYDVVANAHFSPPRPDGLTGLEDRRSFLVCCRFVPEKNLLMLLNAFARYRHMAGPNAWELVMAGDGPERNKVCAAIEGLSLNGSVHLVGYVQYGGLPEIYSCAGAFVLPSLSEPWGLVVNEAMAAGLPVLVSNRCGCIPDLVESGRNGFTFDPLDSEDLTGLMLRVTSMSAEQRVAMAQASRDLVSRWTPETFATNLRMAVEVALASPNANPGILDRSLVWALIHRPTPAR